MMSSRSRPGGASPAGPAPRRLRAVLLTASCLAGLLGLWAVFVLTYTGQRVEAAALEGSEIGSHYVSDQARALLSTVSMPAAVLLVVVILLVGWLRRSHRRAVWAVVAVVGTNLSTQVVKQWVLWRPDYDITARWDNANTLPSGHTAMAASAAVALVLLAGARWRAAAAWTGAAATTAMGYSTLVCQWHRPADVLAAVLMAVAWGGAAVAGGAWSDDGAEGRTRRGGAHRAGGGGGRSRGEGSGSRAVPLAVSPSPTAGRDPGRRYSAQRLWSVLLAVAGALLGVVALLMEIQVWTRSEEPMTRWGYFAAYTAGAVSTAAVSCLAMGLLACLTAWGALGARLDLSTPRTWGGSTSGEPDSASGEPAVDGRLVPAPGLGAGPYHQRRRVARTAAAPRRASRRAATRARGEAVGTTATSSDSARRAVAGAGRAQPSRRTSTRPGLPGSAPDSGGTGVRAVQ